MELANSSDIVVDTIMSEHYASGERADTVREPDPNLTRKVDGVQVNYVTAQDDIFHILSTMICLVVLLLCIGMMIRIAYIEAKITYASSESCSKSDLGCQTGCPREPSEIRLADRSNFVRNKEYSTVAQSDGEQSNNYYSTSEAVAELVGMHITLPIRK